MGNTEVELRKALYGLFRIVRMNAFMKSAQREFYELLDSSDFALSIFENAPGADRLSEAKERFESMAAKIKDSYGSKAVAQAYSEFKSALENDDFLHTVGLSEALSPKEKSNLFSKAFNKVVPQAEVWDEEQDFYSYFIETVKEIIMPTKEMNLEADTVCPYCDGEPKIMRSRDFFGPHSGKTGGYVWGCECGAYADMDEKGNVIGKLGDTMLHQKRDLLKGSICELCTIAGLTVFESLRWFSLVTGMRIESVKDVEFLDFDACNTALKVFIYVKQALKETTFEYPKDLSELFLFFTEGGRLFVCNAYGFQYGKLLIPSEIGPEGIRVCGREGMQSISLSTSLKYEFNGNELFIVHPSGRKEKFRMMPEAVRSMLFGLNSEVQPAANVS